MRKFRGWWVVVLLIAAGLGLMWQRPLPGGQPTAPSAAPRSDAVAITQASAPVVSGLPDAEASATSEESFEVFVTAEGVPVLEARVALARQSPTSPAWRPTWEAPMEKRTDARGRVEFSASNGNWILGASKDGFATSILDVVKAGGEKVTTVRVSLERGTDLEGLAIDSKDAAIAPAFIRAMPLGDRSTRRRGAPLGVVETMVDARGAFRFSGLAAGWWRLEGDAEGAGHAEPLLINVPTLEVMKLRFRRSGFLEGVVVRADGGVAPQAVVVVGSGEGTESLLAGATGTFSIERMPGSYRLSATAGGLVGAAEQVALVRAGATTSTRITVSGSGGELVGSVKRDDGIPVAGARVFMSLHNDDGQSGPAITDADGGWRLGGIPRGTYDVEAEAPGLMRTAETGFFVTDGATVRVELVLGRLGRVTGTVESSSGTPMSLRVLLRSLQNAFPERQALADGAGRFSFEDVPPGPAFVTLRRNPERVSRPVDLKVQAGATSDVKVIVIDAVQLELELDRTRCTPPSEVTVVAMEPNASQKRVQQSVSASLQRITLPLTPGAWNVMGWDVNMKSCTLGERMKSVTLEAGKKPPLVRLVFGPPEPEFEITVLESDGQPSPFASVTVRDEQGGLWASSADADGRASVQFPSTALMTVIASKEGRSAQLAGVRRAAGQLTLTLRPAARIHLRIEGATGMTRVSALLDGAHFADEVRGSGAELWIDEVPAGVIALRASSADDTLTGQTRVVTSSGQTAEGMIRLQAVARLYGKAQLSSVVGASILLTSATLGIEHAPLAPDGSFEFEPLFPGDYTAKVVCPNCGALATKPVKLVSGATIELLFP